MGITRKTLHIYWEATKQHKVGFIFSLIAIPISALATNTILSYFFSQSIAQLLSGNYPDVWRYLIIAGIIGLLASILNFVGFQVFVRHEAAVTRILRDRVFTLLINKDLQFFVNEKVGALTSKYIDFVRAQIEMRTLLVLRTLGLVLSLAVGLTLIAIQSWVIAALLIFLLAAIILEVRWSLNYREKSRTERRKLRGEIHGAVADTLTNSLVVKTFANEKREETSVHRMTARFEQVYVKDIGFMTKEGSFRVFLMIVIQLITISVSAWLALQGQVDVATVIFSLTYLQLVGSQLFTVGELLNGYEEALLEATPMTEILDRATVVNDKPDAISVNSLIPQVVFENVSFNYGENKEDVIDSLDLTIPAGQKVGLVGHSGAGKTTITHLLLRFSDVTQGSLSVGGYDIRDITQKSLRQNISYVPQEPLLFHRSLRENIAYGNPDASEEQIRVAAQKANALEFIDVLPEGLDTLVGERGIKLSGGQRQRIAIARAILKEAPLLILDEATSALDSESERLIQESLKSLMDDRTSIVIAHRLSTIAQLDRIIVLDKGRVAEDGTHAELIAKNGIYAKLWNHQSGGFIDE